MDKKDIAATDLMCKINRITAWLLFLLFLLYLLTGLDTVKRLMLPQLSSILHLRFLIVPVIALFVYHTSFAAHLAFKRRNIWNMATKAIIVLYITGMCVLAAAFYFL